MMKNLFVQVWGGAQVNDVANVIAQYLAEKGIHCDIQEKGIELKPGTEAWLSKKKQLEDKGFTISDDDILYEKDLTAISAKQLLRLGYQINVGADDFDLYYPYDKDGNGKLDDIRYKDVGGHAMTVAGVSDDGKLIVSSWGNEYLLDPEQVSDYVIYDYFPDVERS